MKIVHLKRRWLLLVLALFIATAFWIINVERQVEEVEILKDEAVKKDDQEVFSFKEESNDMIQKDEFDSEFISKDEELDDVSDILPPEKAEDWELEDDKDFFVEYRLQRDRVRSKEIERLNEFLDNPNTSQDAKQEVEQELLELVTKKEKELIIENLIRANGFEDAILFYRDSFANVVVRAENLSETEVMQIAEIVSENANIQTSNVKVVEHN
ncbi:SpoIIIAH-like family protein [Natranaerobius thermophilus]|uniref:Stage III sporulation protein AH n=1 Tax=Natranaerobius thermophilus (strain ATCC BAA-1301 / DSM 18059 / JW/NM-WN-LF) TaxID=457570 RepID=B2A538_NATTJ|nr:SpoIIIAH-like family protein [Natranaerobius thermophilus]ACB85280.1 hypothetical protein Nther_1706 [Natranaerobius thermophilus JW/NM-WN-LF]